MNGRRHQKPRAVVAEAITAKEIELNITPEQVKLLLGLNAELAAAQERFNNVCAGVVAGHGYTVVKVIGLDAEKNTLTIIKP